MSDSKTYAVPNAVTPSNCISFDEAVCNGCNRCIQQCQMDVFHPNPVKGKPPIVLYPDECWYCGCCVLECPRTDQGAIRLSLPLMLKVRWKDKRTGEHFRIGASESLPPNKKPPVGGWNPRSK